MKMVGRMVSVANQRQPYFCDSYCYLYDHFEGNMSVLQLTDVVLLASCHCVALDVEGRCYTWGRNEVDHSS